MVRVRQHCAASQCLLPYLISVERVSVAVQGPNVTPGTGDYGAKDEQRALYQLKDSCTVHVSVVVTGGAGVQILLGVKGCVVQGCVRDEAYEIQLAGGSGDGASESSIYHLRANGSKTELCKLEHSGGSGWVSESASTLTIEKSESHLVVSCLDRKSFMMKCDLSGGVQGNVWEMWLKADAGEGDATWHWQKGKTASLMPSLANDCTAQKTPHFSCAGGEGGVCEDMNTINNVDLFWKSMSLILEAGTSTIDRGVDCSMQEVSAFQKMFDFVLYGTKTLTIEKQNQYPPA